MGVGVSWTGSHDGHAPCPQPPYRMVLLRAVRPCSWTSAHKPVRNYERPAHMVHLCPTCMPLFRSCSPAVSALAEQLFEARHTAPGPAGQPSVPDLLAARVRVLNMKLAPASDNAVNPCPMPQVGFAHTCMEHSDGRCGMLG